MNLELPGKVNSMRYAAGRYILGLLCGAGIAALSACSPPGNGYSQYRDLPGGVWLYGDTLVFTPEFSDSIASGHLVAAVSHDSDFRYSSLWLEVVSADPAGVVRKDTVSFPLADSFGRWQGNGLGAHLQMSDTISRRVTLVSGHPVKIRHIMRADTLRSVQKIGIFFLPDE